MEEYKKFVRALVVQLNAGRRERRGIEDAVSESAAGGAAGKHEGGSA